MRYRIVHKTEYKYSEPASLSQNELFLQPRETVTQRVSGCEVKITPPPQYMHKRVDYFGNTAQVFMVQHPHQQLTVEAVSLVETLKPAATFPEESMAWESVVERLAAHTHPSDLVAYQFIFGSPMTLASSAVRSFAEQSFAPGTPVLVGALDLMNRIFTDFTYDKEATGVDTPVEQVLLHKKGVCQDFAHLMISGLRSMGLAARYVSGYLETQPPPGKEKLVGADASHAWLALFVPELGWIDLDPTNNLIPGEQHITLAWGRDYGDVTPVKGVVMGGGLHNLSVSVDVRVIV